MLLATGFQPLYKQVYELLTARLVSGEWKPSESLPSEQALAAELGVSQGTVRKALNDMVAKKLLERRQGKGTYVAEYTQESSLFRFFHFSEPGGPAVFPESQVLSLQRRAPIAIERERLGLSAKARVVEMTRLRTIQDLPVIVERITQPLAIFPDIDKIAEIPNSLYTLYQSKFNISIVEVREALRAVALGAEEAGLLNLKVDAPAIMIERCGVNIDGRVVEWRRCYCDTRHFVYSVTLR